MATIHGHAELVRCEGGQIGPQAAWQNTHERWTDLPAVSSTVLGDESRTVAHNFLSESAQYWSHGTWQVGGVELPYALYNVQSTDKNCETSIMYKNAALRVYMAQARWLSTLLMVDNNVLVVIK